MTCAFAYDGDGQRVRQTGGGAVTEYIVDRTNGLAHTIARAYA